MKKPTKRDFKRILAMTACVGAGYIAYQQNKKLDITKYTYHNEKIPKSFHGFTMLHVSDLHNARFGYHQRKIIKEIQLANPDIIVVSGDLIDKRRCTQDNIKPALRFMEEAMKQAPVYYVPGNHEATSSVYPYLKEQLLSLHVEVLSNSKVEFSRNHESITLLGVKDPKFYQKQSDRFEKTVRALKDMSDTPFTMLLSHRPEQIPLYADCGIDLCFCGHAHGGQIRIPYLGGLYAPDQGIFPTYTNGRYVKDQTTMFVSRGLGNSKAPLRIHNHPQLLSIRLYGSE